MNATRKQAIEELRAWSSRHWASAMPLWLSGSCARGKPRQHSDIDIAILPRNDLPSGFFAELAADFEESDTPYDVDLVDLRHAEPSMVEEVRREGVKWRD